MTTSRWTSERIVFLLMTLAGFLVPQLSQAKSKIAQPQVATTSKSSKQKKGSQKAAPLPEKKPAINENPLTAVANISPSRLSPGAQVRASIQLDLDPQYHAYKEKFLLRVLEPAGIVVSDFQVQPMVKFYDKLAKKEKEGLSEKGEAVATLAIPETLGSKPTTLVLELAYQACAEDHCLFPKRLKLEVPIEWVQQDAAPVLPSEAAAAAAPIEASVASEAPVATSTKEAGSFQSAMEKGAFFGFLFAFVAGILTSLTPCVFPMIPITLSIIGARTMGQSKWKGFTLSIFYTLGIAITYAVLGVVAAKSGSLFGGLLANPFAVSAIAILFVVMGLSMYGLFELQVPAFIRDKLSAQKTERGFAGAFFAGLIAGIVASPCIGPVLVVILTYVAQTQNVVLGFFLLFTYAMGLGVLFIVLGTFSGLLGSMPKAGGWMDIIKFVFGTSMMAMAIYYLSPIISKGVLYFLSGATCILISSAFGAFAQPAADNLKSAMKKGVMFAAFLIGVGLILSALGIFGASAFGSNATGAIETSAPVEPGASTPSGKSARHGLQFKRYSDQEFDSQLGQGRPILIDFRADWCAACKELEAFTFSDTTVQAESAQFVILQVDATNETEENDRLRKKFKIMGLPTILFYSPTGNPRGDLTLTGFESASHFLERLKRTRENR